MTQVRRIAAFADGAVGGNPAGVWIGAALPSPAEMQTIAAEIGFSETAFAARTDVGYSVRYFAPTMEVPFCGHATIALGAALGEAEGPGVFALTLNDGTISVEAGADGVIALQSPPTEAARADPALTDRALALFGLREDQLDPRLPPVLISAGARHLLLALDSRATLAAMDYAFQEGRALMQHYGLVTIALVHAESDRLFHARNPFAAGGIFEDPATGAAAAALGGHLRDQGWPHGGQIEIRQGDDMGAPCRLFVSIPSEPGTSVRVSGRARSMDA